MTIAFSRSFKLSPAGSRAGISCDADGVFVGDIALLKRKSSTEGAIWQPRCNEELSEDLSRCFGLPIDFSPKQKALIAVANALNRADVAHAQLVTLHMAIPDPLPLEKQETSAMRDERIRLIQNLHASGLIKSGWDPDDHPRWPAGSPDSQGGEFAPKGASAIGQASYATDDVDYTSSQGTAADRPNNESFEDATTGPTTSDQNSIVPAVAHEQDAVTAQPIAYNSDYHDQVVEEYAIYLRQYGFAVQTEVRLWMADKSALTRIDILARSGPLTVGFEVKNGNDPGFTPAQLLIYQHLMAGESIISDSSRIVKYSHIAKLGFARNVLLPPIPVLLLYNRDPDSPVIFKELDPEKMIEQLQRLKRRISK